MEVIELLERFGIGAHFAMGKCTFRLEWLKILCIVNGWLNIILTYSQRIA